MNKTSIFLIVVIVVCIIVFSTFFVVDEVNTAIVLQFGKPVRTITTAGLRVKLPFIQDVIFFDKRILEWDGEANKIPTRDKKFIWVDPTARWRISDPLLFYQRVRDGNGAQRKLDDIIDGSSRDIISNTELIEIVRNSNRVLVYSEEFSTQAELEKKIQKEQIEIEKESSEGTKIEESKAKRSEVENLQIKVGRDKITDLVLKRSQKDAKDLGIEIIDVMIKRVNYTEDVQKKVFDRMVSERNKVAEQYRAEGRGERAKILGLMDKRIKEIRSESNRRSEMIRGEADAIATKIYAESYNQDPEFYVFLKVLKTYRDTIDEKTMFIFSTKNEFLKYLKADK